MTLPVTISLPRESSPEFGIKGKQLAAIPNEWTLPFFLVSSEAAATLVEIRDVMGAGICAEVATHLAGLARPNQEVIVRSSGSAEGLESRGQFDSRVCPASIRDVLEALRAVVQDGAAQGAELGAVIQRYVKPAVIGHLANERRVASRRRDWQVEAQDFPGGSWQRIGFRVAQAAVGRNAPLRAETLDDLRTELRTVAAHLMTTDTRYHCEWVWSGARLFVVQVDPAPEWRGPEPGSSRLELPDDDSFDPTELALFVPSDRTARPWRKTQCLEHFEEAGLPTAQLAVLEDPDVIEGLGQGLVPPSLQADLDLLASRLVVVRTDRLTDESAEALLLPRTDAVGSGERLKDFLCTTTEDLLAKGATANELAYLVHAFIPARAGAWALAAPDSPTVLIDSSWGLPDGLMFYPHDSFEVVTSTGKIRRRVRSKTEYVDFDSEGQFIRQKAGVPWDWKPSLTDDEVRWIGKAAKLLADQMGQPLEVMFFVGVRPSSGYPAILPWYEVTAVPEIPTDPEDTYFFQDKEVVETAQDLQELSARRELGRAAVRLRPEARLVHDKQFVRALVHLAKTREVTIELEGSILSHLFYLLQTEGVAVRPVDPFPHYERKETFGKLVRDSVPLRIERKGESAVVYRAGRSELLDLLKQKAVEEAYELRAASSPDESLDEVADLTEVLETLIRLLGLAEDEIANRRTAKREERGSFEDGLVLLETVSPAVVATVPPSKSLFDGGPEKQPQSDRRDAEALFRRALRQRGSPVARRNRLQIPLTPPLHESQFQIETDTLALTVTYGSTEVVVEVAAGANVGNADQLELPV